MSGSRLDYELDHEVGLGALTAHGGVPALIEHFRSSGGAAAVDGSVPYKRRKRGLSASEMCESLLALWACGGEPCEDLDRLRGQDGLGLLLGHGLPAAQTARDFLSCFDEPELPLLGGGRSAVREEGLGLRGLARASSAVVADLQARAPQRVATLDLDATIVASSKRAAQPCYDGRRGYQPVVALWAEQDVIVADEFRDGNVSAQSGNRRVIERALAALPEGVEQVYLRADSALYDHSLMVYLDRKKVGFALSVPVSPGLARRMQGLDEAAWQLERCDEGALRHWAVLDYLPDGAIDQPEGVVRRLRYIAIRISRRQGSLFADGETVKHVCSSPTATTRKGATRATCCAGIAARRARSSMPMTCWGTSLRRRRCRARSSAPMRRGSASTWCSTTCCLRSSASACPRSCIASAPNGCASWCSTPWPG